MTEPFTPNIFNWHAAQVARDAAIQQVGDNTSTWWMRHTRAAIEQCARTMPEFTTDDVWALIGLDGSFDHRAMGAAMRTVQRDGLIVPTDHYRNSEQVSCHGRPKRLWRRAQ